MEKFWDGQAYLTRRATLPNLNYEPSMGGILMTPVAPLCQTTDEILNGKDIPGRRLFGAKECVEVIKKQKSLQLVKTKKDLLEDNGKTKVVLGLHHPPIDLFDTSFSHYEGREKAIMDLGIRVCQFANELPNVYGGGFATPEVSLAVRGTLLYDFFERAGIIPDFSHLSHQSARDLILLLKLSMQISGNSGPRSLMASHTGSYEVYNHPRNLPDDVLRDIADLGGVVGVFCLTFGLHPEDNTMTPFLAHLKHIVNVCGEDAVCIGTDSVYEEQNLEALKSFVEGNIKLLDARGNFRARFPEAPLELNTPNMLEVINERLLKEGLSSSLVSKIMSTNLRNFFLRALPE